MKKRTGTMIAVLGLMLGVMIGSIGVSQATNGKQEKGVSAASDCGNVRQWKNALRYQQQGAELRALQMQSYRLATSNLEKIVEEHDGDPADLAIMSDLDETAMDNTALMVRDMQACHIYNTWDTWADWERNGNPTAIPGAIDFFEAADDMGVSIYYVSDRREANKADTLATLRDLGFPAVTKKNVLLLDKDPKQVRREYIQSKHDLVMQLGDNLHDFHADFAPADWQKRQRLVKKHAAHFGTDWIVLPNASYGRWSEAKLRAWKKKELVIE